MTLLYKTKTYFVSDIALKLNQKYGVSPYLFIQSLPKNLRRTGAKVSLEELAAWIMKSEQATYNTTLNWLRKACS